MRVCPMQLQPYLKFDENNKLNDINCIKCKTCVNNCPKGILEIK
ncbi:MAG: 4Fe-4S dicluster domain-containing protein [Intestinibacter bartlettii]